MKKLLSLLLIFVTSCCFATQPQKIKLLLNAAVNTDHAPIIIADQQGYFEEQGLSVEFINPRDENVLQKLTDNQADIGITYQPKLIKQINNGLPLISIGTLIDKPLNCLVSLKDRHIKNITDLKGKRIAVTSDALADLMLKVMLEKNGMTINDVKIIRIRDDLTKALISHQVDAVTGLLRNTEVPALEADHYKIVTFFPEEYGIPTYNELVFVINKNKLNDDRFPRFLAALQKAVAYLDKHPQATWEQFTKQYPVQNTSANRDAWFATMPYFAENPSILDRKEWNHFANFMKQHKLIETTLPVSQYAVQLTKEY